MNGVNVLMQVCWGRCTSSEQGMKNTGKSCDCFEDGIYSLPDFYLFQVLEVESHSGENQKNRG